MESDIGQEARKALASFLTGYSWESYLTQTFARKVYHPRQALALVSQRLYLPSLGRAFLAAEQFYLGGYHIHGLVAWRADATGRPDSDSWSHAARRLGRLGWNRIAPVRSVGGASAYCAKYITKRQVESDLVDYDIYGTAGWLAMED